MLTSEDNHLLTSTGPGTPAGDLLRRYWQPVALAEELLAEGAPLAVRVLSEDLVLFRNDAGVPALLDIHCSHRAADLSYGRVEDGGLRCLYHGWLYDVQGNCLEQPGEPADSGFKEKVHHRSYPCADFGGLVFAYMGPGEPPLLPRYEFLTVPARSRFVSKFHHDCNYLQSNEGNIDPQHLSFLHRMLEGDAREEHIVGSTNTPNDFFGSDETPVIEVEETDFGLRIFAVRGDGPAAEYVRISNFIYPNLAAFPGRFPSGYGVNWHVPIDDTHHWKYSFSFDRTGPIDMSVPTQQWLAGVEGYHHRRNLTNRYEQDRSEMTDSTYIGLGTNFQLHDKWATEGAGPIQDRTREHLGYTDKAVAAQRRLLIRAIRTVADGGEPPHVLRDPAANDLSHLGAFGELLARGSDWNIPWLRQASRARSRDGSKGH